MHLRLRNRLSLVKFGKFLYTLSEFETQGDSLAGQKGMAMLGGGSCMLNIRGETLSEVEMYTLVDTLVERQAKMQVKSLKNPLAKSKKAA